MDKEQEKQKFLAMEPKEAWEYGKTKMEFKEWTLKQFFNAMTMYQEHRQMKDIQDILL